MVSADTVYFLTVIHSRKQAWWQSPAHFNANTRSQQQTCFDAHLCLLPISSQGHQSAARWEPSRRVIDVDFMCVTPFYACWVGACGGDNGGAGLSASLSIPNLQLHAKGGVSDSREGNFRWTNGRAELHHSARTPLFLWNQTHPHGWHGGLAVIEMSAQEGVLNSC